VGGRRHRYGYTSELTIGRPNLHGATIKLDADTGTTEAHEYGPGRGGAEPLFAPRADSTAEDDGWLLTLVYDAATDHSELCVLDAQDVTGPEVARIRLPQRVPYGFHGNWVPDSSVAPD
jgi:carotenoid cleavage dioxygenase